MSAQEYAVLAMYVCVDTPVTVHESILFDVVINGRKLPPQGQYLPSTLRHKLYVFPTAAARLAALELARDAKAWEGDSSRQLRTYLRALSEVELRTYRAVGEESDPLS
jgi:hypothetical protein